ncbi:hypothetical protein TCDM_05191 [Trypanosoma cruzi Dm28c]|uniref:Thioredoxin domain-containing protein n=2 Tax=Trypanosoma cruzi TaxID=5693 RepID=V5AZ80_TRYCR|nr:hypothetical protein TCDM_05191 [Trypanosoma cruzi Dm28c]PBJ79718.1 hypothetical protein BCY84_02448 [Trypanosoma cruzi cruzi]PWU97322.1 hypothetical protein C4B63_16g131 [Trypanosoma cruzi]
MATATATNNNSDGHTDGVWPEFSQELCEELNEKRCLVLAVDAEKAAAVCRCVDGVIAKLGSGAEGNGKPNKGPDDMLPSLQRSPRVRFTTGDNIARLQRCTAVYGRFPMLLVLEMYEDRSFVLDLDPDITINKETEMKIELFLRGVAAGDVPRALQGAVPPANDCIDTAHNIPLKHGLCAVTSTLERLKRKESGGAVCLFWSEHCAMCSVVLMMVDRLVGVILEASEARGVARPFSYIACNIDHNDFPEEDWPQKSERQIVPTIAAYNGNGERFVYGGRRMASPIISFICTHCLPSGLPNAAQIASDALAVAEKMKEEELWGGGVYSTAEKDAVKEIKPRENDHFDTNEASDVNLEEAGQKRLRRCGHDAKEEESPESERGEATKEQQKQPKKERSEVN